MRLFRSILAVSMAFLVLFASTSFTVGFHQCGGEVRSMALFGKADTCPMERQLPPCHRQLMKSCCEDHELFHQGEDFKAYAASINLESSFVGFVPVPPVLIAEVVDTESAYVDFIDYDPPLRDSDLTVSLQVFLI